MKLSIIVIFEIAAGIPSDIFVKPPSEKCNDFQILPNPRADQDGYRHFTKYVNVLDCWSVLAEDGISDEKVFSNSIQSLTLTLVCYDIMMIKMLFEVLYAAIMSAQILDNNEDGQVDDPLLSAAALENDGQIAMFEREGSPAEKKYNRRIFRSLFCTGQPY